MYDMLDEKAIDTVRLECEGEELMNVDNDQKDSRIVDFKMAQFQNMMDKIVSSSIKENLKLITQSVSAAVSDDVIKQMDVLIKEKEEQEEIDRILDKIRCSGYDSLTKEEKRKLFDNSNHA